MKTSRYAFAIACVVVCSLPGFGASSQWIQQGPQSRNSHTAVWDAANSNMIVFGGQNSSTNTDLNDVWLVNSGTDKHITETQLTPSGTAPAPRFGHVAAYDAGSNRMVIFGGGLGTPGPCANDAWILDGANGKAGTPTWLTLTPSGALPPARVHHVSAYDAATNTLMVFGGSDCGTGYFSDVWVLSNANGQGGTPVWTQLSPTGTIPAARQSATAVYDSANNILIVYGGDAGGSNFGDVSVLSNANGTGGTPVWTLLAPTGTAPLERSGHSAIYDAVNNRMTVFGGFHLFHSTSDVFVLTSANGLGGAPAWSQVLPVGTAPMVGYHSGVYDQALNLMHVYAGTSSLTKLSGDDHDFILTNANGIGSSTWARGGPPARYSQAMYYDSSTNSMFVLDGAHAKSNTLYDDYWQTTSFAGSSTLNWIPINVSGTHPKARYGHSLNSDSANNRLMLFGGSQGFPTPCQNDYWVMIRANNNGVGGVPSWIKPVPTGTKPGIRARHNAAYDSANNRLIVFGGFDCTATYYNDVYVITNANAIGQTPNWTKLSPSGTPPSARQSAAAAYDAATNKLIVYGGDAGGNPFGDVFLLSNANGLGGTPVWTQLVATGTPPSARSGHTGTYDPGLNRFTTCGGFNGTSVLSDCWGLSHANGNGGAASWTKILPTTTSPARRFQSGVYDPATNSMYIFGGIVSANPWTPDDHAFTLTHANGQ